MPMSPEEAMADCQPESSRSSLSSSSNAPQQQSTTNTESGDSKPAAAIEKTISCVSCRKRKLKCDRAKPKCGTCSRLKHGCEYPERRRNLGSKRRNMKELEARLAQVETQLVAETSKATTTSQAPVVPTTEPDWDNFTMDMNMDMGNIGMLGETYNVPIPSFDYQAAPTAPPEGDFFSQELISLGLLEALPPQHMMDELHLIYFEKHHPTMPMLHKYRYLSALTLPNHMQPPICLRYAIWTIAASITEKYYQYENVLYERARKYIELAEMKGHGETFVSIQFAQAWGLIATYEAKKTYFTRAWMSTGRMTRLTQMLGLQRIDSEGQGTKRILPPAKDWVELEERRRVFWAAFYGDRWASSGTGWPMIIDEDDIQTNLPSSEEAFYNGIQEMTTTLSEALTPEGAANISPFGGVVLSACLFGHNFQHLHQSGPDEHPEDLANGEFWKRHRKMDNVLSNTFMFLPDHLRLPRGLRDLNVVFLHMNIHASTICLHQAAVLTAEKNNISQTFVRQSRNRSIMAAEEIANTMRLVSHLDASNMNSWMGFCLYVAAGVFIQDQRRGDAHPQSITNLEFVLAAMKAIGSRHSITNHFTAQLELDIECSGLKIHSRLPNMPLNGIIPSRDGAPMPVDDIRSYWESLSAEEYSMRRVEAICPYIKIMAKGSGTVASTRDSFSITPQRSDQTEKVVHLPPEGLREKHVHPSYPNWDPPATSALSNATHNTRQQTQHPLDTHDFGESNPPVAAEPNVGVTAGSPFDIDSFFAGNTPSSDSSNSNVMQVPYRQANGGKSPDYALFQTDPSSFITAPDWTPDNPFNAEPLDRTFDNLCQPQGAQSSEPSRRIPRAYEATDAARQFFGAASWDENPMPPCS